MIILCFIIGAVLFVEKNFSLDTKKSLLHVVSTVMVCIKDVYHFEFGQTYQSDVLLKEALQEEKKFLIEDCCSHNDL
jgi:hypothetical protein